MHDFSTCFEHVAVYFDASIIFPTKNCCSPNPRCLCTRTSSMHVFAETTMVLIDPFQASLYYQIISLRSVGCALQDDLDSEGTGF